MAHPELTVTCVVANSKREKTTGLGLVHLLDVIGLLMNNRVPGDQGGPEDAEGGARPMDPFIGSL